MAVITAGYFGYRQLNKKDIAARYLTAAIERGTLVVSVSGSGQVSASDQADIKSKVSGDVVYIGAKGGQEVKSGVLLAQIDASDAQKALTDAKTSLETAELELEKLMSPPDELSLLQAESSLIQARDSRQKAEGNIEQSYEDAFNDIANVFLDFPTIITSTRDVLYSYGIAKSEATVSDYSWNLSVYQICFSSGSRDLKPLLNKAENDYKLARESYDKNFKNYTDASHYSEKDLIESLLDETVKTAKLMAESVKSETNLLDVVVDDLSSHDKQVYGKISEYQSDLKTYTGKTNSHLANLLSVQRSLQSYREALVSAERTIREKELSLAKLKAGPDELEIRAKKIAIQQKKDSLSAAQRDLVDCYIRAPFDGIVAGLNVKKGDSVSSGSIIVTFITKQKIAEISLNEIDVAKVKVGQKATLVFDAAEDLTITGEVIEIDAIGAVSQGVVTYGIKIAFDAQDERIKPGMSLSAAIIIDVRQNALLAPNSAIKEQGGVSYVQLAEKTAVGLDLAGANLSGIVMSASALTMRSIQVGLLNETMTEITGGLNEGDVIITQTISANPASNSVGQSQSGGNQMQGMMRIVR